MGVFYRETLNLRAMLRVAISVFYLADIRSDETGADFKSLEDF